MRRPRAPFLAIVLLAATPLIVTIARAEIYQWVDADGKVHFGDQPQDPATAARAKPVQLGQSYEPHERTAEEQAAYELQQRSVRLNAQERARLEKEEQDALMAQRREEKTKRCSSLAAAVKRLTGSDDSRVFYYAKDENGEAVSEERQQEIIGEYKVKMAELDCP